MTDAQAPRPVVDVDFLSRSFVEDGAIRREGGVFETLDPWAVADFGSVTLAAGWWVLECRPEAAAEDGIGNLEVMLFSPQDQWIRFSGAGDGAGARVLISADRTFRIRLIVRGWPGETRMERLRLRRLGGLETSRLYFNSFKRLVTSEAPLSRIRGAVAQVLSGRAVGVRGSEAATPSSSPKPADTRDHSPSAGSGVEPEARAIRLEHVEAVVCEGDELLEIAGPLAADWLRRHPQVRAAYCDVDVAGRIQPHPGWDAEFARHWDYGRPPIFYTDPEAGALALERGLRAVAERFGDGSVGLIPLPLCRRSRGAAPLQHLQRPQLARAPLVSAIIPTKNRRDLLSKCLEGLVERTGYPNLEVIVIDNGSDDPALPGYLDEMAKHLDLRHVRDESAFNFSHLMNRGFELARGEVLLLLNDDIEPQESGWLDRMVESVLRPDVGCVGARLHYPGGAIQHAGVAMGLGGVCGHLYRGLDGEAAAENAHIMLPGTRRAVTGASLAVRREVFERAKGFDEALAVALNDIDFCLRCEELGLINIYRGDAALIHHESQSRGADDATVETRRRLAGEVDHFLRRWPDAINSDPYFSRMFDPMAERGEARRLIPAPADMKWRGTG